MKKLVSLALAIGLCFLLCVPALAHDTGTATITTTLSSGFGSFCERTMVIKSDGSLWMWGGFVTPYIDSKYGSMDTGYRNSPVKIMDDVISVSCSDGEHCAAIKKDRSLWLWGLNDSGQLGNGKQGDTVFNEQVYQFVPIKIMDDVAAVSCGRAHTAVIKTDGSLWLFGDNDHGQIGNNYVGDSNKKSYSDGKKYPIQTVPVKIMEDVICVSCGDDYTAAVKKDGTLWTWGDNQYAQLGNGEKSERNAVVDKSKDKHIPQKIMDGVVSACFSDVYSFAIKSDETLWRWGWNDTVPYKVTDSASFVSPGFVIKTDGSLYSIDDLSTKIMDNVCAVSGTSATFAITNDGDLYGWGKVEWLGNGKGKGDSTNKDEQLAPIKVLSGVALPSGTNPVVIPDIPSSWAKGEVDAAISANLVPDNLQKNYRKPVSRGDVAQMFINLIEQSSGKSVDEILSEKGVELNKSAFTDTADKAVLAANALGIIYGTGNNKFSPEGTLTRAQIAAIMNRTARVLGVDTEGYSHSFTDISGHWANSELGWPSSVGIINGVGNNKFSPDTQLTTEQAIAITYRALQILKKITA